MATKKTMGTTRTITGNRINLTSLTSLGNLFKGASAKQHTQRLETDQEQRRLAERAPGSIILKPSDVHGEYDFNRSLMTTLGGHARMLEPDDLPVLRKNIATVQKNYKGGIRARQVLDLSLPIDRQKAAKEIHQGVPYSSNNGMVRFVTNSGPNSPVSRHYVNVHFLSFSAAVASGKGSPQEMANWLKREPLKIDCDCGRWRYWYRYIATIGQFNAGRDETGYPKIRNPNLSGVACKHILRVMTNIESSIAVTAFLSRMIDASRKSDEAKSKLRFTRDEQEQMSNEKRTEVGTTSDRRLKAREKYAAKVAASKSVKKVPKKQSRKTASRVVKKALPKFTPEHLKAIEIMMRQSGMAADAIRDGLEKLKNGG